MKVLISTPVFPPEIHPTAIMARELAAGLVSRGASVRVAAGLPHSPYGVVDRDFGGKAWSVRKEAGYTVLRLWHPTSRSRRVIVRALVMLSQMLATSVAALAGRRPDIVLSFGGPPLVGPLLSGCIAMWWRIPLLTVIHDVYPDIAIEAGALKSRVLIALARWAERQQYRLSARVIVIGEKTRSALVESMAIDPNMVEVLPVWLDPKDIVPSPRLNTWRTEQGIHPDQFVVLYSGTAGLISGAEILEDVARLLPEDVVVMLVGGGSAWTRLASLRDQHKLPGNLRLLPYQPRERLNEVQASSDLSLLTLLPGRGRTSVPSKLQGYMAAGRPVLAAVDAGCDTAELIRTRNCGVVVPSLDPSAIARAILDARSKPERSLQWGLAARAAFERDYTREPIIDRYFALLKHLTAL